MSTLQPSTYTVAPAGRVPDGDEVHPWDGPAPCAWCGGRRYTRCGPDAWMWDGHIEVSVPYGYRFGDSMFDGALSFCTVECAAAYMLAGEYEPLEGPDGTYVRSGEHDVATRLDRVVEVFVEHSGRHRR